MPILSLKVALHTGKGPTGPRNKYPLLLLLLVLSTSTQGRRPPTDRPNFILSLVDDLGYGDLGITGHPTTNTPNIDRYSTLGRRLTTWYSGYPVCSASRTALLTGRQAPRVGMPGVINSLGVEGLPLSEQTIANALNATHKSFILGKWHQGQRPNYLPKHRGFDAFYGLPYSVDDGIGYTTNCTHRPTAEGPGTVPKPFQLGPEIPLPLIRQLPNDAGDGEILSQPTNLVPLTANMLSFFKNVTTLWQDEPWLAYVAHPHVHTATANVQQLGPFEQYAGCSFAGTTLRGGFGDALSEMDWMLGEMIAHVDVLGLSNNTMVLFLSDNGPWLEKNQGGGSVGIFSANAAPYRNVGKGSTWEGGIRMPAFVYWPGQVAPFTRTSATLSTLDVLPTLVALAGGTGGQGGKGATGGGRGSAKGSAVVLDGLDASSVLLSSDTYLPRWRWNVLLPFWNGPNFSKPGTEIFAGRFNQYKIHWVTSMGLTSGTHNLSNVVRHDPPLFFDVEQDPSESFLIQATDIAPEVWKMVQEQKKQLTFVPNAIDPRFGMQWALCCSVKTNCTCQTPEAIHGNNRSVFVGAPQEEE